MSGKKMRVRFAPSPTGPLHIGGARSALFNWLLAKKSGGSFVLRIEDTDLERSSRESEDGIKQSLRWLGLDWDEGIDVGGPGAPYRQTERLDLYKAYTEQLLAENKAYRCYCSDEELEEEREKLKSQGHMPRYMGKCSCLSQEELDKLGKEGRKYTVRFRVPKNQEVVVDDAVRGRVVFDSDGIGDFVIVKSDGIPTYNYAVCIDDALMEITHVIRGEEHLSNTPRQILVYQAFGWEMPVFAHVSLILGKDRSKMSKRHGSTAIEQYKAKGYLPSGLLNFLALLGWAPHSEQEIFSLEELVQVFSLEHCAKNPAVFDVDKLNWINSHHIKQLNDEQLYEFALPHLLSSGFLLTETYERSWLVEVVATTRDHVDYAAQIPEHIRFYFEDEFDFDEEAKSILRADSAKKVLEVFVENIKRAQELTADSVKEMLKVVAKESGYKGKEVFMPVRVALTGQTHGPELGQVIPLLGFDRIIKRVQYGMQKA